MNTITTLLDTLSSAFGGSTATGLDLIQETPTAARVAEHLLEHDLVPATSAEIISTFESATGRAPRTAELAATEGFLSSFGWAA
ncbi:hypothetical protein NQ023_06660 [Corynebacterium phoceense]|uniref:Uncharacterized protein n=1 Tax=Corynebacterium phoceense TaxID=1686286 RepID=A0A540R8T3_9CORY|nr:MULTISPECIES: hypothetical protein [Corynebacterium]MBF9011816.1 hypothetical protein [Corynebacterium phoceense]MCQ9332096.1 hypothetical protein [Corynebacterium phoceense]MCQ9341793.1 hypothetical protein [Corynebacterium phoceense]MCQ9345472.1 hypothetical protein [Corynebacterium phoceense]MCQ9348150.1 hypothetical protein [Corynebacterium phoceense]